MVLTGYTIQVAFDGSIVLDQELKLEQLKLKEGDVFVIKTNENGTVILQKQNG